jgi:putative ABC transport system permease protein
MFKSNLIIALRNLRKHKTYSLINIAGLAIGMAVAILILLWVQYEMSCDRFHEHLDRLYLVAFTGVNHEFYGEQSVGALGPYLEEEYPEIIRSARLSHQERWKFEIEGEKHYGYGRYTDPDFFHMFSFPFIDGDPETALADKFSIVITESMARRIFGDEDPKGKALRVGPYMNLTVTSVMEDTPDNTEWGFEFLVSTEIGSQNYRKWDVKCIRTFVMLDEHNDRQGVSAKIVDVYNIHNEYDTKNNLFLEPLKDLHLHDLGGGGRYRYILIFSIMAAAILLMACINFMNLSTARAELRVKEIGIKKVVGASRRQLIYQFVGEAITLSLISLCIAIVIVELLLPIISSMFNIRFALAFSFRNIVSLIGIALVTGILAGSYPAFYLSSFQPIAVLTGRTSLLDLKLLRAAGTSSGRGNGPLLRRILVTVQFIVSIIFIVSIVVIFSQLHYLRTMDMGFDREHIVLMNLPRALVPKTPVLKANLLQHSNIHGVTVSRNSLVEWWSSIGIGWEGKRSDQESFDVGLNWIDYDYLETFQMELAEGRFFSRNHRADQHESVVVNEALVRAMGITDPVGRTITLAPHSSFESRGTIIGVVKDYHTESAHREIRPFLLRLTKRAGIMCIRIGRTGIPGTIEHIRNTAREIVPDASISIRFFNEETDRLYRAERLTGAMIIYIGAIAIFISCLGLFGLSAFSAGRRSREIGIRKVLGASMGNILHLLLREFVVLVILASIIACPVAYFLMNKWLENYVYRITINPWSFGLVTAFILAIALATVSFQTLRAAAANPVDSIKYE